MADRVELVEAALDAYPEGVVLLDGDELVVFWNRAAELITGYPGAEVIGRRLPDALEPLSRGRDCEMYGAPRNGPQPGRGSLVHAPHKLGRDIPSIARRIILRDNLGARIGVAAVFHPGELFNALPHGETSDVDEVQRSQSELQDRLGSEHEMFVREGTPLAILWIAVDQAHELRKTHGAGACESMLETVERVLANGLHPGEEVGRWGEDEFLVLSHEKSPEALAAHARAVTGLARTAVFRWWGDRLSITVSVGVASAEPGETLSEMLARAQAATRESASAGGNHVTIAARRQPCLPS
jgi:diguanylate cyclase (GGDEF)-like protein/PAS domain S-box-containing protein